jgi:hypothetical protein
LFRKRQSAATLPADETIPDDILANIPDVGSKDPPATSVAFVQVTDTDADEAAIPLPASWQPAEAPRPPAPLPRGADAAPAGPAGPDVAAMVQDVRRQMESVFSRELGKVEDSFSATVREMQARLERATAEAEGLRRENEALLRMKAEYDRKGEALKQLAKSFEKA